MWQVPSIQTVAGWPFPNYGPTAEKRGPELLIFSSIFLVLATICVFARLYTRLFTRRWMGIDDYLVLLGYVSSVAVTGLVDYAVKHDKWNQHIYDFRVTEFEPSARILYFSRIAWGIAASTTRLSVLCLYFRLIKAAQAPRSYFWINTALTAATVITMSWFICWGIWVCKPISAYWSFPPRPTDHCLNDAVGLEIIGVLNTIQEFITATLPVIAVFLLRVRKDQRWTIIGVLSMGYSVGIAGILRTYYIFRITQSYDPSWYATPHWAWSETENYLSLICASAAALRPVVGRLINRFRGLPAFHLPPKPHRSWFGVLPLGSSPANTSKRSDGISTEAEWVTAMSRTIDLEGIANDGYGYQVYITGPTKAERRRVAQEQFKTNLGLLGLTKDNRGAETRTSKPAMKTTEFSVEIKEDIAGPAAAPWGFSPLQDLPTTRGAPGKHSDRYSGLLRPANFQHSSTSKDSSNDSDEDDIFALPIMSNAAPYDIEAPPPARGLGRPRN